MNKITMDTELSLFRFTHAAKLPKDKWGYVVAYHMEDAIKGTEDIEAIEYVDVAYVSAGIINDIKNEGKYLNS